MWNNESKEYLINKYFIKRGIAPGFKPKHQLGIFKILDGGGKIKHTPNQEDGIEIFHYDFYKCDEFSLDKICLIGTIPINGTVPVIGANPLI